jgi:hypothetical protein
MVKRTMVVLGILSLTLMVVGGSFALASSCADKCLPLYVPVDVPDTTAKTIVSTWECKIVGPCPAPTPPCCGPAKKGPNFGILTSLATAIATPFDMVFGGFDGVYGCLPNTGLGNGAFGGGLGGAFMAVPGMLSGETTIFGGLW